MRLGGDEFLCVLSDATAEIARTRFESVQAALAADAAERCEIRFGVAELTPDDSALDLVKRADAKPHRQSLDVGAPEARSRQACGVSLIAAHPATDRVQAKP